VPQNLQSQEMFNDLYKKLNPKQKEAVDTIYGPLMIVAGPGTGKTQILSLRIANILRKTDTSPDSILALPFTESAAHSMRRRLVDIIGSSAYSVNTTTFHSFCNNIIRDFPDEFPKIIGSRPASDIRQIGIIERIIIETKLEYLKPYGDPSYYVLPVLQMIRNLKRENISADYFKALIKIDEEKVKNAPDRKHEKGAHKGSIKAIYKELERQIEKNKELVFIYELYEKTLLEERLYDYEDMILETIHAMESNKDLLLRLQETYQFILADEHQDANASQNKILELLASFDDNPNICVVGDEKQAIFRFQGASLENFLSFKKKFPKAKIVSLEENYRSRQEILDAAHSLISKNNVEDESLRKRLVASGHVSKLDSKTALKSELKTASEIPAINLREFTDQQTELAFLARDIEEKIKNGVNPRSIAVIYRENRDVFPILSAFERVTIPYVVRSDQNVLSDMHIRKLVTLFRAVLEPARDDLIGHSIYFDFLNIDPLDANIVSDLAKKKRRPILQILNSKLIEQFLKNDKENDGIDARIAKLRDLSKKIKRWSVLARNTSVTSAFETISTESGFISHLMSLPDSPNLLLKVDALFREATKLLEINRVATLGDFAKYLDTLDDYDVLIRSDRSGLLDEAVELMTAHKSKGLEFEHVYIVGVVDRHWGNKRGQKLFRVPVADSEAPAGTSATEDERRLFYVALTRARNGLYLSFSHRDGDGRECLPSQFIQEIDPALIKNDDVSTVVQEIVSRPAITISKKPTSAPRILDKTYLTSRFLEQGLSVTALNNYLKCPWQYFFTNLIRLPRAQNRSQLYGIAVHEALKHHFTKLAQGEEVNKEYLVETFKKMITRQPLNDNDLTALIKRGTNALGGYFDTYNNTWVPNSLSEYGIAGVFVDLIDVPNAAGHVTKILLRGKLDKVEFISDTRVNVVDYKTRQPQTRNAITGETKSSSGDYFRQLVFYKLLLDGHENGKYLMESGEIDFIEPNEKGVYRKEKFFIEPKDTKNLTKIIQDVSKEILSFSFTEKTCGNTDCEFCDLRKTIIPTEGSQPIL